MVNIPFISVLYTLVCLSFLKNIQVNIEHASLKTSYSVYQDLSFLEENKQRLSTGLVKQIALLCGRVRLIRLLLSGRTVL